MAKHFFYNDFPYTLNPYRTRSGSTQNKTLCRHSSGAKHFLIIRKVGRLFELFLQLAGIDVLDLLLALAVLHIHEQGRFLCFLLRPPLLQSDGG